MSGTSVSGSSSKGDDEYLGEGIQTPHDHDVLSGRGNFVNYHPGNEHFRALVRKHKVAYVACPKPQKGKFSQLIYDEIQSRNPPGRFLKQHPTTKLWHVIGEKKALDKTRQALREGAPDIQKELVVENSPTADQQREQYNQMLHQHSEAYHHVPDLHSSPVKMAQHVQMTRSPLSHGFPQLSPPRYSQYATSPTRYGQYASSPVRYGQYGSSISPLPHVSRGGYPMMHQGGDIMVPALFASPFHNQAPQQMHQSMQQSLQQLSMQQQHNHGQHSPPHMHMHMAHPVSSSVPGSHTVRPVGSQSNMPVPNMNPSSSSSSSTDRPASLWINDRSKSCPTEENEFIAPLASESNRGVFFSKYGSGMNKDASNAAVAVAVADYHASTTSLDVTLASERQHQPPPPSTRFRQANNGNFSQRSLMSLSVDGMGNSHDFGSDANYLSALFNSSLKITTTKPSTTASTTAGRTGNMAGSGQLAGTMEMSVNTLDEPEDMSYFGDSAMMKMTESQAEMSLGNVFEDTA